VAELIVSLSVRKNGITAFAQKNERTAVMRFGVIGLGEVIRQCNLKIIRCTTWWHTRLLAAYTDKKER